jgi:CRISPR-associated protein (TIGR03986 family)
VVWAEVDRITGPTVTGLALAAIWRSPGQGRVRDRFPPPLAPCDDPEELCISCRLFGATDDQGGDRETPEQRSYRGHLRVGAALPTGPVSLEQVRLAPLAAPRPGAGQLYLDHDRAPAGEGRRPTREWGADPDWPTPRPLRGRKHYWHGDPAVQAVPRHLARPHHQHELAEPVELVPAGSSFQARISFENLSPAELGSLLAVLDPTAVLGGLVPPGHGEAPELAGRLGGGKPLGLGSIDSAYQDLEVHSAASRYGHDRPPPVDPAALLQAFVAAVPEAVQATWPDLAAVLDLGHVDPRWLWYPPGSFWPAPDQPPTAAALERFDRGFEFWQQTSGRPLSEETRLRTGEEQLPRLAAPRHPDQYLDIIVDPKP